MASLWEKFQKYFLQYDDLGFAIDISRMNFADDLFEKMRPQIDHAFRAMVELEGGEIANPDEQRMVGHYWLRAPGLAPNEQLRREISAHLAHRYWRIRARTAIHRRCARQRERSRRHLLF